jgi:lon-related putative ATP-dependent protease
MLRQPPALTPEALRRVCDPAQFDFETTATLPPLTEVLGQPRAVQALAFGTSIASHGFNLFALGLPGSGKTTLIREYLERQASSQPVPPDLCYIFNFADPRQPLTLSLPAGQANRFKQAMATLVGELQAAIPRAFESQEYTDRRDGIVNELDEKRRAELSRLDARVAQFGFKLVKTSGGLLLAPALNGTPLSEHDVEQLPPEHQEKLVHIREKLEGDIEAGLRRIRELEKGARDALHSLDTETARFATQHLLNELREQYAELPQVLAYLEALQADVIERAEIFRKGREGETPNLPIVLPASPESPFTRYQVNVLVDNGGLTGAPVIVENNPTYHNLTGRIEHQSSWGAVFTDFSMIKAGALHRANGGYLILPARECLLNPYAWDGLKRALKDRLLRIEELGSQLSLLSTVTLEPQPIPLEVKVILIGSPLIYYTLNAYDEDFEKLFKVKAEFATQMDRIPENERAYALFVGTIAQQDHTLPFDRAAVARVIEYGSRLVEDQHKLSTRFGEIADLIREAAHGAARNGHASVAAQDVQAAEGARRYRQNLVEEQLQESIREGTLLIDTEGSAVGRVNGLSVVSLGDHAFGHPSRITATVGPGQGGVVSLEREVELSGPIHGKGVLILGGYLAHRYGQSQPLSLAASLVFEQTYGRVEGDSASLAELYALLSALAGCPLRQGIAVTGSINQHGQVQPVGGLDEKIEGFFDICRSRGLHGQQGVLIPDANRRDLMLRDDVVEAVRLGQFNVWVIRDVDEGIPLLSGLSAGGLEAGQYPAGSFHRAVADRLGGFAQTLKSFSAARENGHQSSVARLSDAGEPSGAHQSRHSDG